jgi:hypothetical protein
MAQGLANFTTYEEYLDSLLRDDDKKYVHCKKRLKVFPSPAGMSLTNLSLAGNNLIIPGQGKFVW